MFDLLSGHASHWVELIKQKANCMLGNTKQSWAIIMMCSRVPCDQASSKRCQGYWTTVTSCIIDAAPHIIDTALLVPGLVSEAVSMASCRWQSSSDSGSSVRLMYRHLLVLCIWKASTSTPPSSPVPFSHHFVTQQLASPPYFAIPWPAMQSWPNHLPGDGSEREARFTDSTGQSNQISQRGNIRFQISFDCNNEAYD